MNKDRRTARIIQVLAIMVCLGMAVLAVQNTGLISKIGTEDIYWERARFLLGQKGATTYSGSSICSLGYSLLLVPICVLIKSPYAAYKAAILLNGIFLCGSYVMAVLTAKKLFSKEKESFLSVACFFAVCIPAISISMFYSEPDMMVMFLIWCSIYLIYRIWTAGSTKTMILFIACLLAITFLQIEMLGIIMGAAILLWLCVRKEKITEITFLKCVLALLIGIIAEDVIERVILYRFAADMDITVRSSLEVALDSVKSGVGNGNLFGTLLAKIYILSLTGMFLIYPACVEFIKDLFYAVKQKKSTDRIFENKIIMIFLIQLIFIAMFDSSRHIGTGYFSVNGLLTVASPILLISIVKLKDWKNWILLILESFLITGLCTYKVVEILEKNNINSVAGHVCGIFRLFQEKVSNAGAASYMAVCVSFLVMTGCFFFFRVKSGKMLLNKWLKYTGTCLCTGVILVLGICMVQSTIWRAYESEVVEIAPVAYLANSITGEANYYYVAGSDGNDAGIAVMQSLMSGKPIQKIEDDTAEQIEMFRTGIAEDENPVVITGTKENQLNQTIKECLEEFDILYMTPTYAVWTRKGSQIAQEMEEIIETKAEEMVLQSSEEPDVEEELIEEETQNLTDTSAETETDTETETVTETETSTETDTSTETEISTETEKKTSKNNYKKVYKSGMNLAHGTYRVEIYFNGENIGDNQTGKIRIRSQEGSICAKSFDKDTIMQDSNGAVIVEFSSRDTMHNVEIQIEGNILSSASVEHIYYRKINNAYRIGYATEKQVKTACSAIKKADENCEQKGRVVFVDAFASEDAEISVECFQNNLNGYEINGITREELQETDAEYLIATTSYHSYYEAMDRYSIISRTRNYTVLVRNDSEQYQECKAQEKLLSEGQRISIDAFVKSAETPVSLESGSYEYEINVTGLAKIAQNTHAEELGKVIVRTAKEILAEETITKNEVSEETGEVTINVPLLLKEKTENIYCEFRGRKMTGVSVSPLAVLMTAEKYEYGQEEEDFTELTDMIQSLAAGRKNNETIKVGIVQTTATINENQTGYHSVEEALPECQIEEMSFSDARRLTEDALLLTYGISKQHFQLLDKYDIIGQAGQYTLWVRNCGELLLEANQEGIMTLNSDNRLSLECIAKMSGQNDENIENLPKAEYNLFIELEAEDLEEDDTVEVNLFVDKSQSKIESEIQDFIDVGYTREEAEKRVESQIVCGSGTYEAYAFNNGQTKLVAIKTDNIKIKNLTATAFSWKGKKIKTKILWITMNQ